MQTGADEQHGDDVHVKNICSQVLLNLFVLLTGRRVILGFSICRSDFSPQRWRVQQAPEIQYDRSEYNDGT